MNSSAVTTSPVKQSAGETPSPSAKTVGNPQPVAPTAAAVTAKPIPKSPAKPLAKPAEASGKRVLKPTAKVEVKAPAKPLAKVPVKAAEKATRKTPVKAKVKADKIDKEKKAKLVRDSFTIPKGEYVVLDELKQRAGKLSKQVKKSELIRAGIKALAAMQDAAFLSTLRLVPTIKTGRPAKD